MVWRVMHSVNAGVHLWRLLIRGLRGTDSLRPFCPDPCCFGRELRHICKSFSPKDAPKNKQGLTDSQKLEGSYNQKNRVCFSY